ncbi:glutathione S-transferase family protein [Paucibacter sp. R3-3]|uniref:Glutathione S-transferase family protein n=1 Tax=Roseateles agri TaxID=3098619 RepID=A0ABU5DNU9_9BURK|nr:glutathione S-transferase family protein [Paucibacter sp. R3-3]MDY0747983.1 glutathione S-transferase family protein [Paucibacter sp. R3-3]
MSELILHHYAGSPFSEKVRLVLGFKQLAWRSVDVPVILPKPDVVALTGGYRRTPFLQVGADIYCDSALMCEVIDATQPFPPLFDGAATRVLAQWADTDLFWAMIAHTMQPAGFAAIMGGLPPAVLQAFAADRAAMTAGMKRPTARDATAQLTSYFDWLEQSLADGRSFLCGDAPSVADFSVAQSVWFIRRAPPVAGVLEPFVRLAAWYGRVAAFGHGMRSEMSGVDALALAASSTPVAVEVEADLGFAAGDEITVTPTDYAQDPVAGTLVGLSTKRVTLRRVDERAGTVHVHFPRVGYAVKAAG